MEEKRSSFSGKLGFILAAAGSAVGLGNIWRFPYLAAEYGGGIFLLVYIILSITFGFAMMVAEVAIGRKTKLSPIGAYKSLHKKWSFLFDIAHKIMKIREVYDYIQESCIQSSVNPSCSFSLLLILFNYKNQFINCKNQFLCRKLRI